MIDIRARGSQLDHSENLCVTSGETEGDRKGICRGQMPRRVWPEGPRWQDAVDRRDAWKAVEEAHSHKVRDDQQTNVSGLEYSST